MAAAQPALRRSSTGKCCLLGSTAPRLDPRIDPSREGIRDRVSTLRARDPKRTPYLSCLSSSPPPNQRWGVRFLELTEATVTMRTNASA